MSNPGYLLCLFWLKRQEQTKISSSDNPVVTLKKTIAYLTNTNTCSKLCQPCHAEIPFITAHSNHCPLHSIKCDPGQSMVVRSSGAQPQKKLCRLRQGLNIA